MSILDAKDSKPLLGGPSFSLSNRVYRTIWSVFWLIFAAWTPAPFHAWRRSMLKLFGAEVGPGAHIYGSARVWDPSHLVMGAYSCLGRRVDCYSMGRITLGDHATVSQDASLCAGLHDIDDADFQLLTKPIVIGAHAWVAAGAFVGPGVTIGDGAVLGARAVTFKDLRPWGVYIGNPSSFLRLRARSEMARGQS